MMTPTRIDVVRPLTVVEASAVRNRHIVVERAITEILSAGRMRPETVDAMLAPYRRDA